MESNRMDDSIKKALENFQVDANLDHWESMEALLNDPANADLNELAEDQILRNKLNDIQPEAAVGHWALMEAQLAGMDAEEGEELEDMMLDGKAYESLNTLKRPYNEAHWPIMEEKIVAAFSWRKKAVRYKVAELAILLLAFLTVFQYWPEAKEILPRIKKQLPKLSTPIVADRTAEQETKEVAVIAEEIPTHSSNVVDAGEDVSRTNSIDEVFDAEVSDSNTPDLLPTQTNNQSAKPNNTKANVPSRSLFADNLKDALNNKALPELPNTSFHLVDNRNARSTFEAIPIIPSKPVSELEDKPLSVFSTALKTMKFGKAGLRIGMYGMSSTMSWITTPSK